MKWRTVKMSEIMAHPHHSLAAEDYLDMKCSICGLEIKPHPVTSYVGGNNAWPVNEGRCCDTCNETVVVPRRLADMYSTGRSKSQEKRIKVQKGD